MGVFPSKIRFRYLAIALGVCAAVGLSCAGVLPAYRCPFATFLGISCPMCGTTRAWLHLFHGDIAGAFFCNPLFLLWGFWCIVAFMDLLHKGLSSVSPTVGERCMIGAAKCRTLKLAHVIGIVTMLFYANLFGPTASLKLCRSWCAQQTFNDEKAQ